MLSPQEFSVGFTGDATTLSLLLPRNSYEQPILLSPPQLGGMAVFLEGEHRFLTFPYAGNTAWKGLLIPGIRFEVDEKTAFAQNSFDVPKGTLVRRV